MKNISKIFVWSIVIMACLATALSFLDRQVLSITIIKIQEDLHITNSEYGLINTAFLISYAIMFTLGGILIDKYGSRIGLAISVGLWSVATFLHGFATNVFQFSLYRFLLGLGEGGAFPGAIKAVVEWVPKKHHALANGIAIGGSAFGAVIAPPLAVYMLASIGWRAVFFVVGIIGFIWVAVWLLIQRGKRPVQNEEKLEVVLPVSEENATLNVKEKVKIMDLLKIKEVWVFIVIRFLLDPVFYFFMFWIPKFLNEAKGVELGVIGDLFWIPFLALGISNMFGGFLSDKIFNKTGNLNFSRKIVMGIAALLTSSAILVQYTSLIGVIMALLSCAFFAHGLWITNYITSISDMFGRNASSTIVGFSGSAGALSSLIINPFMGLIIANYSYNPLWVYSGIMYSVAFIIFIVAIPKIKPIIN